MKSLADRIREHIEEHHVRPARAASCQEVTIRAGDVHSEMGLASRMPAVCAALDSRLLADRSRLRLLSRSGPHQGANVFFRFSLEATHDAGAAHQIGPDPTASSPGSPPCPEDTTERVPPARPGAGGEGTVYLVSCVSVKGAEPTEARSLYVSDWFKKARSLVERSGAAWFILSAEHGLVHPMTVIAPYERTLNTMSVHERRAWASRVIERMNLELPRAERIVVLAGRRYREFLMEHLRSVCSDIQVPLEGLGIGEQLGWLSRATRHGA